MPKKRWKKSKKYFFLVLNKNLSVTDVSTSIFPRAIQNYRIRFITIVTKSDGLFSFF